jgi:hypothetical protein
MIRRVSVVPMGGIFTDFETFQAEMAKPARPSTPTVSGVVRRHGAS